MGRRELLLNGRRCQIKGRMDGGGLQVGSSRHHHRVSSYATTTVNAWTMMNARATRLTASASAASAGGGGGGFCGGGGGGGGTGSRRISRSRHAGVDGSGERANFAARVKTTRASCVGSRALAGLFAKNWGTRRA